MQGSIERSAERLEGGYEVMKKNDYLLMLFQDNETETEPKKELHTAVLECTVEALSQTSELRLALSCIGAYSKKTWR